MKIGWTLFISNLSKNDWFLCTNIQLFGDLFKFSTLLPRFVSDELLCETCKTIYVYKSSNTMCREFYQYTSISTHHWSFLLISNLQVTSFYQFLAKKIYLWPKKSTTWMAKKRQSQGVFLVKTRISIVPLNRDHSVNTDSWISTVPRGSERSEWASPWMERASEASVAKRSAAERVSGVSGASERT